MEAHRAGADHVELLRRWVLAVLVLGLAGTVTELVLLEHYEQPLQLVPLVLIVAAVAAIAWQWRRNDAASLRALAIVMVLFVLAGCAGVVAHFHGSAEFQIELNPSMSTWELVEKIVRAKAPPLLAPGMMLQMGLLGLAYVYSDVRYRTRIGRVFGIEPNKAKQGE
jgi:predicted membrane channel-forming protein YqfA (hemolysin III family)